MTFMWMRHQIPTKTILQSCFRIETENAFAQFFLSIVYMVGMAAFSLIYSWLLFCLFVAADLVAVLFGLDIYLAILHILPQDFLEARRLAYAALQDIVHLCIQLYVMASGLNGMSGPVVAFAFLFTIMNISYVIYTLFERSRNFAESEVTLSNYVRCLFGLASKDRRYAAAYTGMIRKHTYPYEHILLDHAHLKDADVVALINALVDGCRNNKKKNGLPRTLQLHGNKLGDLSIKYLAQQMEQGRLACLDLIDLSENDFGDDAILDIAAYIKNCPGATLRTLDIEGNSKITEEGYNALARAIRAAAQLNKLSLDVLVVDHRGRTTELLREVCTRCKVETFYAPSLNGAKYENDVDSEATVMGSVRMATHFFPRFGRRR